MSVAATLGGGLRRAFRSPGTELGLHVLRVVLAALLALVLSLALDMGSPRTAVFAVFLVMQQRSGLVFQKSYYRLLGNFAAVAVSILLIGYFVQTPVVFVLLFALWVAFCTAGSFVFRNFQSYGFVLAGYTVCFVALLAVDHPEQVFDIGVARLLEMFIGIACAAFVSDTVFPRRMADLVQGALKQRFARLRGALQALGTAERAPAEHQAAMLGLIGDALGLEALRSHSALESTDLRRRRQHLARINHGFMGLSTTLHAVVMLRRRCEESAPGGPVSPALHGLAAALASHLSAPEAPDGPATALPRLHAWQAEFPTLVAAARADLPAGTDAATRLDFETGAELLARLGDELHAYWSGQLALESGRPSTDAVSEQAALRFSTRSDPMLVGLAALRGFLVTITACYLWWLSGWHWGFGAVTNVVAPGTLFASLPNPLAVLKGFVKGCLLALAVGLVWNFWLIPLASDWVGLCLLLLPVFAFAAWYSARPQSAGVGTGFYIVFVLHSALERNFNLRPEDFIEAHLADLVGVAIAAAFYLVIDPNRGAWRHRRIVRSLRAQLVEICRSSALPRRETLESASRDLVQSIATRGELAHPADRWVFDWLLRVLEVGRAAIDLRAGIAEAPAEAVSLALPIALERIAALFEAPSDARRAAAVAAVEEAIAALAPRGPEAEAEDPAATPRLPARLAQDLRLDLHFIRTALLDSSSRPAASLDHA